MASIVVEGSGSLVNVDGVSDLSWEPLLLPHQDLGVIQCVVMNGRRGVFHDGRVGVFFICVFSDHVTVTTIIKDRVTRQHVWVCFNLVSE